MTGRIYEYFINFKLKMVFLLSLYFWKSKPPAHSSTRPHKPVSVCGVACRYLCFCLGAAAFKFHETIHLNELRQIFILLIVSKRGFEEKRTKKFKHR